LTCFDKEPSAFSHAKLKKKKKKKENRFTYRKGNKNTENRTGAIKCPHKETGEL